MLFPKFIYLRVLIEIRTWIKKMTLGYYDPMNKTIHTMHVVNTMKATDMIDDIMSSH